MKIETEACTIQSDEQHHDVECFARYENDPRAWKRRVWLDKESNEMVESDIIEYSADDSDMFDEIKWEEVPREIREALDGRVDAAKDDILAPLMEEIKLRRVNKYAKVQWTADDVLTLRPDLSITEAENFLSRNQKHIRDRLIELGWEVMDTLLAMDEHLPEKKENEND